MFRAPALLSLTLVAAFLTGSCSALSETTSCYTRSQLQLPDRQKVRPHLSNGEEGRQLYDAVMDGDIARVEEMVRANPRLLSTQRVLGRNERAQSGNSGGLLAFAVANCDPRMLGALLELGIDPDGTPPGLALTYAALADDPLMATMLLQAGASPDASEPKGTTPLKEVLYYERPDAVELLVRGGANVNRPDPVGASPLELALTFQDYKSAEILLKAGANPWQVGNKGTLSATLLTGEAKESADEPQRLKLLEMVRARSPIWPPPSAAEVREGFLHGDWPNAEMKNLGLVATEEAMNSMRLVDRAEK